MSDNPFATTSPPIAPGPKPDVNLEDATEVDPRQGLPASVQVEEASAPMPLQPSDPNAKGPWIQYNGIGTVRIMDEEAWKQAGVASDKYAEWSYLNQKRLPRSMFTDEELQYLLRVDDRFELVEDTEDK